MTRLTSQSGFTRLQVPRECQELFFNDTNLRSQILQLRNSGTLPLGLSLTSTHTNFIIQPDRIDIPPEQISLTEITFNPDVALDQVNALLILKSIEATYRLALHGNINPIGEVCIIFKKNADLY